MKMMEKLWGDNFFDPATKKWTKKATGAASCKRGFVQFVYEPIKTIIEAAMADNKKKLFEMCAYWLTKLSDPCVTSMIACRAVYNSAAKVIMD